MTQFGPPPLPHDYAPAYPPRSGPPPWSASAIGAFVLSLLGWMGFTAILGIIFGIVGIFATQGGKRRGRGLATAAIPISMFTGAIAVFLLFLIMMVFRMAEVPQKMEGVFQGSDVTVQIENLRKLGSQKWNRAVTDDALRQWLTDIRTKYGAMTSMKFDVSQGVSVSPTTEEPQIAVKVQFVSGNGVLRFTFDPEELWAARLSNVEIDGVSPKRTGDPEAPAKETP